jgi:hypothetical protein
MAVVIPDVKVVYQESVVRLPEIITIPFDEGNVDYQQYLAWLADGNEPMDFDVDLLQGEN